MTSLGVGSWFVVSQRDPRAVDLYSRHYSNEKSGNTVAIWLRCGIAGPGETLTMLDYTARALWVWRLARDRDDGQQGVECAVFRNEGSARSSELVIEAMERAWKRWPGERLFTYVDPRRVLSPNPGYCFKVAGWSFVGLSMKRKLHILEVTP